MSQSPYTLEINNNEPNIYLADVSRARNKDEWLGTLYVVGEFGGATVTANFSPDNGVTFAPATDSSGNPFAASANAVVNIEHFGTSGVSGKHPKLYITVSGGTSPDLKVVLYTND